MIDDTAATYGGRWLTSYHFGGSYDFTDHSSAAAGASATFSFVGESIAWVGATDSTHRYARASVGGGSNDNVSAVAAPSNGRVYVTGTSWGGNATRNDIATVAYNIFTGQQLWVRRYNGPLSNGDYPGEGRSIAARAGRVFVAGPSFGISSSMDYVTIAYRG